MNKKSWQRDDQCDHQHAGHLQLETALASGCDMRRLLQTVALSAVLVVSASTARAQVSFGVHLGEPPAPRAYGKALTGGAGGGLITSIALGFIGALLGPWVAHQFHLSEPLMLHVSGQPFPIIWSIIGGALFVALLHLVAGRR